MGPEASTQRTILDYLNAKHIWNMRLNTGATAAEHNGKKRFIRFSKPGTADILCTYKPDFWAIDRKPEILWIEVKAPKGKLSEAQIQFHEEVTSQGHHCIVARSLEDVQNFLAAL